MLTTSTRKRTQLTSINKNLIKMNFFLLNFSFKLIESINQSLIINLLNSKTSTNAKKIKKSNSNQLDNELLLMKVILSQRN